MTDQHATTLASHHDVATTLDRLASIVAGKGLTIFARIDHAGGARQAGLDLRPTELLLFGRPEGGTPLMQDHQLAALDLPLRALGWEDEAGQVWLSYYSGSAIAARHDLSDAVHAAISKLDQALAAFCAQAVRVDD